MCEYTELFPPCFALRRLNKNQHGAMVQDTGFSRAGGLVWPSFCNTNRSTAKYLHGCWDKQPASLPQTGLCIDLFVAAHMHMGPFFFDQQTRIEAVLRYAALTTYAKSSGRERGKKKKKYPINSLVFGVIFPLRIN